MKDELGGKITTELTELRAKTYRYKKVKGTKFCVKKENFNFKYCSEATQLKNRTNQLKKKCT